jgi:hypothetical protein
MKSPVAKSNDLLIGFFNPPLSARADRIRVGDLSRQGFSGCPAAVRVTAMKETSHTEAGIIRTQSLPLRLVNFVVVTRQSL